MKSEWLFYSVSLGEGLRKGEVRREREGGCHGGPWQRLLINIQNQLPNCLSSPPQLEDICILASGNLSIKKKKFQFSILVGAVYNLPVTSVEWVFWKVHYRKWA